MTKELTRRTLRLGVIASLVAAAAGVAVLGQGTSGVADPSGGLKELTAELRQLRMAVEESTRAQAQTQALGVYLTVEQGRIVQVATRHEAARKELESAEVLSRTLTAEVANLEAALARENEPARRSAMELQFRVTKQELEAAALHEQQIRNRESDLAQALQLEEARWSDLVTKLEQVIKK